MSTPAGAEPTDSSEAPCDDPQKPGENLWAALRTVSSGLDSGALLQRLVTAACDLIGARYGALSVLDDRGEATDLFVHGIDGATRRAIGGLPRGHGLLDPRRLGGHPLRVARLADHPGAAGFPPHHPVMTSLVLAPVRVRGAAYGALFLGDRLDGQPFSEADETNLCALAQMVGLVLENARAYRVSERRRRWLESFAHLNELLQPPLDLADALQDVCGALRRASGAVAACLLQVPAHGGVVMTSRSGAGRVLTTISPALDATVRAVVDGGQVASIDLDEDTSALVSPLRAHLARPGVLVVAHRRRGRPDYVDEKDMLTAFADHVALSLDRSQALAEREEMAVVADRDRIARELHDVVIQRMFATGLSLQALRGPGVPPEVRERVDAVMSDVDQIIRDIRETIFSLKDRPRDSMRSVVREVVRETVPVLGFAPSVQLAGDVDSPLDGTVQPVVQAVLKEALLNVATHARAGSARVELEVGPVEVSLEVSDNGVGLPEERVEHGLRDARRRATLMGGRMSVARAEEGGTVFRWAVPRSGGKPT